MFEREDKAISDASTAVLRNHYSTRHPHFGLDYIATQKTTQHGITIVRLQR